MIGPASDSLMNFQHPKVEYLNVASVSAFMRSRLNGPGVAKPRPGQNRTRIEGMEVGQAREQSGIPIANVNPVFSITKV